MSASIEIGGHRIGPGSPTFVIAEVGVNHNGDPRLALELIDVAAGAGADAVKFQTFTPELLAATGAPQAAYQQIRDRAGSQMEMLTRLALDARAHVELKAHADRVGILFMSSPFDEGAVNLLEGIGVPAFKIPSGEITNFGLLRRVAATGRPIVMSTGMATLEEVDGAVGQLGDARSRLALLHCVSSYPAEPSECNLRAMDTLRARFDVPIGWSDHTEGISVGCAAVAIGADIVEKHITLDRQMPGPDHAASLEPAEMQAMIAAIRTIEAALGEPYKRPTTAELEMASIARKSLHWRRALSPGELIGPDDLIALRPGTGIPPSRLDELLGRPVLVATVPGSLVQPEEVALAASERRA